MENEISRRFNDGILDEARARFGIAPGAIQALDAFESFIYEYEKDGRSYILRIGHSRRRSAELIHGEVDWINYLAAGGAGVAKAVLSEKGELVEAIADSEDGQFLATAFVKAAGGPPTREYWNEKLFVPYGRLLGRIHRLSKDYQPPDPAWKRPFWDDVIMQNAHLTLPNHDTAALAQYNELMAYLRALPQDKDSFGMIHQDAHGGNFFVDDNYNITLFDIDDCVYGHFIYDIAMVMFYAITNNPHPEEELAVLWPSFMQGYKAENELDSTWLAEIPHFLKLREIDLYAVLLDTFGPGPTGNGWADTFMNGRQEKILQDKPYVNFKFQYG